ncbi:MAG: (d)CMP kinase [Candidatus Sumerlaeales bacterium]|nr:(d)CMP kinase [Candidatus Sumerlaeales bacterium]
MKEENIILIGMPASGKTSVGKTLAEKCNLRYVDLDEYIALHEGCEISEIFERENGEEQFREAETKAIDAIAKDANRFVLATGGGACIRLHNRDIFKKMGRIVWLDATLDMIYKNASTDFKNATSPTRPLLQKAYEKGELKRCLREMYTRRRNSYSATSEFHLDVEDKAPDEIANQIISELELSQPASVFDTVLAIDGPVASGKTTVARLVAQKLGWTHVNTGAMYRCVTYEAQQQGILETCTSDDLTDIAKKLDFNFGEKNAKGVRTVLLGGVDVTDAIHSPEISKNVSNIADTPGVRKALGELQINYARKGHAVLEGRDISTVICPEAKWKVFLVASLAVRSKRRSSEFVARGEAYDDEMLKKDIMERDERDRVRPQGGLKLDPHAVIIDTTEIPLDEVVTTIACIAGRDKMMQERQHKGK